MREHETIEFSDTTGQHWFAREYPEREIVQLAMHQPPNGFSITLPLVITLGDEQVAQILPMLRRLHKRAIARRKAQKLKPPATS